MNGINMNYVILNDPEYFNNKININGFKEVKLNGRERIDGVIGNITPELLESKSSDERGGNRFFEEEWLCGNRGVGFIILKVPQDILYNKDETIIEEIFEILSQKSFYIELGSFSIKNKENKYEYFISAINKNFNFEMFFDDKKIETDNPMDYICKKIEKIYSV